MHMSDDNSQTVVIEQLTIPTYPLEEIKSSFQEHFTIFVYSFIHSGHYLALLDLVTHIYIGEVQLTSNKNMAFIHSLVKQSSHLILCAKNTFITTLVLSSITPYECTLVSWHAEYACFFWHLHIFMSGCSVKAVCSGMEVTFYDADILTTYRTDSVSVKTFLAI